MTNNEWCNKIKNSKDYKRWVGACNDFTGAVQFQLLTMMGLKEEHKLLDIGCGSLRAGKLFIPYLNKGNYYGIEKEGWLVDEVIDNEIGESQVELKKPWIQIQDMFYLGFAGICDFVLCNSVFIHIPLEQIKTILSQIKDVLKKDGKFVFNYIEGEDNKDKELTYPSHVTYSKYTMRLLLNEHGLEGDWVDWWYPGKQKWVVAYVK
jgi:SAM-dependent methyltransferase